MYMAGATSCKLRCSCMTVWSSNRSGGCCHARHGSAHKMNTSIHHLTESCKQASLKSTMHTGGQHQQKQQQQQQHGCMLPVVQSACCMSCGGSSATPGPGSKQRRPRHALAALAGLPDHHRTCVPSCSGVQPPLPDPCATCRHHHHVFANALMHGTQMDSI